jgi:hypothetical protein
MAWKASACAVIQDVIQDASTIAEVQLFGMDWKDLVMDNFKTRGYELDEKKLNPAMKNFIDWMTDEAKKAGETRDYFRLNVVMTPCIFVSRGTPNHSSPSKLTVSLPGLSYDLQVTQETHPAQSIQWVQRSICITLC